MRTWFVPGFLLQALRCYQVACCQIIKSPTALQTSTEHSSRAVHRDTRDERLI